MGLFDGTKYARPVTCARCGQTADACTCPRNAAGEVTPPSAQSARVQREKRRGKWTTVVSGLDANATDLPGLLKRFQTRFGVGGTTRPDGFELQGDHRDAVVEALKQQGYPAKASGG
ncbi:MAG: translation initiation factor [Phycisphaerae bacterium]